MKLKQVSSPTVTNVGNEHSVDFVLERFDNNHLHLEKAHLQQTHKLAYWLIS